VEVCNDYLHGASASQLQELSASAGGLVPAGKMSRDGKRLFSPWKKELKKTCDDMLLKQCTSALGVDKSKKIKVRPCVMQFGCTALADTYDLSTTRRTSSRSVASSTGATTGRRTSA